MFNWHNEKCLFLLSVELNSFHIIPKQEQNRSAFIEII